MISHMSARKVYVMLSHCCMRLGCYNYVCTGTLCVWYCPAFWSSRLAKQPRAGMTQCAHTGGCFGLSSAVFWLLVDTSTSSFTSSTTTAGDSQVYAVFDLWMTYILICMRCCCRYEWCTLYYTLASVLATQS